MSLYKGIKDCDGRIGTEEGAITKRTAQEREEKEDAGCHDDNDESAGAMTAAMRATMVAGTSQPKTKIDIQRGEMNEGTVMMATGDDNQ